MINNNEPLTMVEALELIGKSKTDNPEFESFVKKFTKTSFKDAKEVRKKNPSIKFRKNKSRA